MMAKCQSWQPRYSCSNAPVIAETEWVCSQFQRFGSLAEAIAAARAMMLNAGGARYDVVETNDPVNTQWTPNGAVAIHVGP
jgi:hypothetical protein